ncbi:stage II sporulation protein R [Ectobacillus panaciterrae]|uniref:stage II sporulation protein R n=1 Tax=Ectobacillus panaciterrae TaxID=363872 RepID=UPI000415495C|nr:stage II sporulation protein R [Ectobacillus panaciterrae]
MKKQVIAFLILLVIGAQLTAHFGYTKAEAKVIPNEAIRLRILANSDSEKDQALKRKVRDQVKAQIDTWVADLTSIDDARLIIQSRIPELEQTVAQVLKEEGSKQSYKVEFGKHIKFPTKLYGNFLYPAGEYEAVLVTLGKGEGANWWCVLFPPLCFLDFSSGTAVRKEEKVAKAETVKKENTKPEKSTEEIVDKKETPSVERIVDKKEKPVVKKAVAKAKEAARIAKEEKLMKELEATSAEKKAKVEVKEVKEEEEVKVKFFFAEVVAALFSK